MGSRRNVDEQQEHTGAPPQEPSLQQSQPSSASEIFIKNALKTSDPKMMGVAGGEDAVFDFSDEENRGTASTPRRPRGGKRSTKSSTTTPHPHKKSHLKRMGRKFLAGNPGLSAQLSSKEDGNEKKRKEGAGSNKSEEREEGELSSDGGQPNIYYDQVSDDEDSPSAPGQKKKEENYLRNLTLDSISSPDEEEAGEESSRWTAATYEPISSPEAEEEEPQRKDKGTGKNRNAMRKAGGGVHVGAGLEIVPLRGEAAAKAAEEEKKRMEEQREREREEEDRKNRQQMAVITAEPLRKESNVTKDLTKPKGLISVSSLLGMMKAMHKPARESKMEEGQPRVRISRKEKRAAVREVVRETRRVPGQTTLGRALRGLDLATVPFGPEQRDDDPYYEVEENPPAAWWGRRKLEEEVRCKKCPNADIQSADDLWQHNMFAHGVFEDRDLSSESDSEGEAPMPENNGAVGSSSSSSSDGESATSTSSRPSSRSDSVASDAPTEAAEDDVSPEPPPSPTVVNGTAMPAAAASLGAEEEDGAFEKVVPNFEDDLPREQGTERIDDDDDASDFVANINSSSENEEEEMEQEDQEMSLQVRGQNCPFPKLPPP